VNVPPPLVNFLTIEKYLEALDPSSDPRQWESILRLHEIGLPPVVSIRALAVLFGIKTQFIGAMLRKPINYYRIFSIPKGKGKRRIEAPKVGLKIIQSWFGHHLARAITLPDNVYGFVPGKSARDGAMQHCGARWVISSDIENFFQTTSAAIVEKSLFSLGYDEYASRLITGLCTLNGNLAQGSPASPVISNLVFRELDQKLIAWSDIQGIRYTRYADDLVFSGKEAIPPSLLDEVKSLVESNGWKLSEKKTLVAEAPKRRKVYGLLVDGEEPRLTKGYRRRVRAIRHLIESGRMPPEDLDRGKGHLSYAKSVDKRFGD
jgi:RNA-directed DNA polymerase